jgi:peroxiredoxin
MNRLFCILIFTGILVQAQSQQQTPTIVFGKNETYKNIEIKVYTCTDYITETYTQIGIDTTDNAGNFSIKLDINTTCQIMMDLGANRGLLYTEPGKKYEVKIPDYTPINKGNRLNPYFKPTDFQLGIARPDKNEINMLIGQFDDIYNEYLEQNYYTIFKNPKQSQIDSVIDNIEKLFDTVPNPFFKTYRQYKYAWISFVSYMRDSRYVIRAYLNNEPIAYTNPAYMDLFNQLFANYITFYMNTREGERIYSDIILAKSPTYAKQTFANNLALTNDTLQELVLLKGLYDAFYDRDYPINSLLLTLDSVEYLTKIPYHKQIAKNILKKTMQARQGSKAPVFEINDANGVMRKSTDYLANYVYLNFFSLDSYTCQQDLEQLKLLYEKHKADFKVISISIDDDFARVKKYFADHKYEWTLLSYQKQPEIIEQYKVKAYPTYFLIDTDGTLNMSPAPSPPENFEYRFFQLLKSRQRKGVGK